MPKDLRRRSCGGRDAPRPRRRASRGAGAGRTTAGRPRSSLQLPGLWRPNSCTTARERRGSTDASSSARAPPSRPPAEGRVRARDEGVQPRVRAQAPTRQARRPTYVASEGRALEPAREPLREEPPSLDDTPGRPAVVRAREPPVERDEAAGGRRRTSASRACVSASAPSVSTRRARVAISVCAYEAA